MVAAELGSLLNQTGSNTDQTGEHTNSVAGNRAPEGAEREDPRAVRRPAAVSAALLAHLIVQEQVGQQVSGNLLFASERAEKRERQRAETETRETERETVSLAESGCSYGTVRTPIAK